MIEQEMAALRKLEKDLVDDGLKRNDRAHALINACINEGIDSGPGIIAALISLGYNGKHAGIMLSTNIQREPVWPNWGRRDCGQYFAPEMLADVN
ncbi:hypothetical protein GGQ88_000231 [Novosphingobium hassiacum]|uniref:Uncharacterized protein n=1 Tax=Novosphingobium hassiacum TaxID=173676 RepID=A0A7W6EUD1_9SPHN|nr:hypothetical protein [Novosphingobium hassiacum]MBB3858991.1 hypothetical protein [Novosphingobium hassiacum]